MYFHSYLTVKQSLILAKHLAFPEALNALPVDKVAISALDNLSFFHRLSFRAGHSQVSLQT
jgi:hypothetical protein